MEVLEECPCSLVRTDWNAVTSIAYATISPHAVLYSVDILTKHAPIYSVPKNYFNESDGIANVAFARAKGANQPAKGSIMLNPGTSSSSSTIFRSPSDACYEGGPGGSGIDYLVGAHDRLRLIFGDDWDIVGFDPRGIGRTRPQTKCFPDTITHQLLYANTPFEQAYTVPNMANLSDPMNHLALTEQSRLYLALAEARAGTCEGNMDVEDLKFMGTSTVVRDMDFLTQKLDGKGAKM
jgi:pimeloyl-ACP methyl ester carboxylesterase